MERLEKTFDVRVPLRTAYNQWTQFEEFPRFMDGVKEVRQLDDTHLHWRASVGGKEKEWDSEITEQVPDQVIAWHSTSGAPNGGAVRFESVASDCTRIQLTIEYEPETAVEKAGDAMGVMSRQIERTVEDFKGFIERRGHETGAWRGEVHGGGEKIAGPGGAPEMSGPPSSGAGASAAGRPRVIEPGNQGGVIVPKGGDMPDSAVGGPIGSDISLPPGEPPSRQRG